jgi:flagellar hook protein FlgE
MPYLGTLATATSALQAFTTGLDAVGNNIANINTTSFKSSSTTFADTFSGLGTQVESTNTNFAAGELSTTGVDTDLGISGNGYFIVQNPSTKVLYATRDGQFTFDASGYLVTSKGYQVQGFSSPTISANSITGGVIGPIQLQQNNPATGTGNPIQSVNISQDGILHETFANGTQAITAQILLQNFTAPQLMQNIGNNLYGNIAIAGPATSPTSIASGTTFANFSSGSIPNGMVTGTANQPSLNGLGSIEAGTLENSNVDLTTQFTSMITLQRGFDANSRVITVTDSLMQDIVDLKTR